MSTKEIVERNFSRHARHYDAYDAVQRTIGAHLIARLGTERFARILDVGCGTGAYTRLLHERYRGARTRGIDLSAAMIEEAGGRAAGEGIEFVLGDAETVAFDAPFDLITSNACFQWFANLDGTLARCGEALAEGGLLAFSSLGPGTFRELGECLDAVLPARQPISARSFANQSELEAVLGRHFGDVSFTREVMTEEYSSLLELLSAIKYTGTRGRGLDGVRITKTVLRRLEEVYKERIGATVATYEVFYCLARQKEVG
jgi:malonyl-CoA O-methyltransferase